MNDTMVEAGLCKLDTIQALIQPRCINEVWSLPYLLSNRIQSLLRSLCRHQVYDLFLPRSCGLDCVRRMTSEGLVLIEDYSCRSDCNCTQLLFTDHLHAGGVCAGSWAASLGFPVSPHPCQMEDGSSEWNYVQAGVCRPDTERAVIQQPCIAGIYSTPEEERQMIRNMIFSMCRYEAGVDVWYPPLPACTSDCISTFSPSGAVVYEDPGCLADCPGTTTTTTTTITSPNYPETYPLKTWVYYSMSVPAGQSVDIEFTTFDIGNFPRCLQDWFVILDSEGEELLPKACGGSIPDKVRVTNTATLVFYSHRVDKNNKGFSATFSEEVSVVITQLQRGTERSVTKVNTILESINQPSDLPDLGKNKIHTIITRLNPIEQINFWGSATKPVFENTRGRYPWICSFRGRQDKRHYCGATILSRPPGPLVIVTAAHCVFICKSEAGDTLPNCCCQNVEGKWCLGDAKCGVNPGVKVMTGEDAEVICGEFETGGNFTAEESGEEFNIVLQIQSISVHPDYNITRGVTNSQYVIDDIATLHLKVNLSETEISRLTPVCLPPSPSQADKQFGLHAGWSAAPPAQFIQEYHPQFEPFTRDFHKMMHYNMTLLPCQDPKQYFDTNGITGINITYETDSYYPPGTICAREKNLEFCPTSGESGSPLMIKDQQGRFSSLGVNSFLKGCSFFTFTNTSLKQFSENPIVYSRLSCFMPWIADQYNMSYTAPEEEPECRQGIGNINEVTTKICRTTPTDEDDRWLRIEAECIFPFTLDNVTHIQCTLSQLAGFTRPQFICPIRTLRGRGTNYTTADSDTTFCPTNFNSEMIGSNSDPVFGPNGQWELDPDNKDCRDEHKKFAFATCKNTCPGGERILVLV